MDNRWTIRNVSADARAMVDEVREATGIPVGRLVSEAIEAWFQLLPVDERRGLASRVLAAQFST
jgi:hypothetical protein